MTGCSPTVRMVLYWLVQSSCCVSCLGFLGPVGQTAARFRNVQTLQLSHQLVSYEFQSLHRQTIPDKSQNLRSHSPGREIWGSTCVLFVGVLPAACWISWSFFLWIFFWQTSDGMIFFLAIKMFAGFSLAMQDRTFNHQKRAKIKEDSTNTQCIGLDLENHWTVRLNWVTLLEWVILKSALLNLMHVFYLLS